MKHPFRRLSILRLGAATAMTVIAGATLAVPAFAQDEAVVATIKGQPITETDLAVAIADLEQQFAQLPDDQRRAAALAAIIEIRVLADAAEEKGLDEGDEFKSRMELLRQRALHSAYIDAEVAPRVTDEAVRARYDQQVAEMPASEEVRARHILVEEEEEAIAIIEEIEGGADFEEIASTRSIDAGAAAQGGDLGWFGPGRMVPEFEQAAFALEAGAHSTEPVQSPFGWHVIKVEEKRTQEPPAFEQVEAQFRSLMLREAYGELVDELREGAEVEITDPELKALLEPADGEGQIEDQSIEDQTQE